VHCDTRAAISFGAVNITYVCVYDKISEVDEIRKNVSEGCAYSTAAGYIVPIFSSP
jgi:hypothetical protein